MSGNFFESKTELNKTCFRLQNMNSYLTPIKLLTLSVFLLLMPMVLYAAEPTYATKPDTTPQKQFDALLKEIFKRPEADKQIKAISDKIDKKEYESALKLIKAETLAHPEDSELEAWHGTVLLKMDRPDKAIMHFQKAVELSPEVPDYHNGTAYCLYFLKRIDDAIEEFKKTLAIDSEHIDALTGLGVTYMRIGEKDKAMDIYDKLKHLDKYTADKLLEVIKGTKS